jgi:hypothetical protein
MADGVLDKGKSHVEERRRVGLQVIGDFEELKMSRQTEV